MKDRKTDEMNAFEQNVYKQHATNIIPADDELLKLMREDNHEAVASVPRKFATLVIDGSPHRVPLAHNTTFILGRPNPALNIMPDIDLSSYNAVENGVSRTHAKLYVKGGQLLLTDLESANGTFLNGRKLAANRAEVVKKGDVILLGRLKIDVEM
jgi:hypothetical protein